MNTEDKEIAKELHTLDILIGRQLKKSMAGQMPEEAECKLSRTNGRFIRFILDRAQLGLETYQRDLEKEFGITRSTASRVVMRMEEKGMVHRQGVSGDARLKKIELTQSSLQAAERMHGIGMAMDDVLLSGFSQAEEQQLYDFLGRLKANVETLCPDEKSGKEDEEFD